MSEQAGAAKRWAARPVQAWTVRGVVVLAPLAASFLFVRLASIWVRPPTSSLWVFLAWWFGISGAATLVLLGVDRFSRRLLPLSALLRLSLVFPDETPSRLKTALRSGQVDSLEARLKLVDEAKAASTPRESAARLLELVAALNAHDSLTRGHSERVRAYSVLIGKELGLGKHDLELLNWAALLHDIGKLEIGQEILTKPGRPSDEEWQTLRQHPALGETLTAPLRGWLEHWQAAVGYHHERWDGKGYPHGLKGEEIPIAGRIVAVADSFDVITSARSYKQADNSVLAREEIAACAGGQFDPAVVRAFLNVSLGRMRMIMGPLSWLSHAPILARLPLTPAIGTLAGTVGIIATAAASGAIAHPQPSPSLPPAVALAAPAPATHLRPRPQLPGKTRLVLHSAPPRTATLRPLPDTGASPPTAPAAVVIRPPRNNPTPVIPAPAQRPRGPTPPTVPVTSAPAAVDAPASAVSPTTTTPQPSDGGGSDQGSSDPTSTGGPPTPHRVQTKPPATPPRTTTTTTTTVTTPTAAAAPGQLAFASEPPATVTAGQTFTFSVAVADGGGTVLAADDATAVSVSLSSDPSGGTLSCSDSGGAGPVTVNAGVASFSCSLDRAADGYVLEASAGGGDQAPANATSDPFSVDPGAAAELAFTTQPSTTTAGTSINPAVQVSLEDSLGNTITTDNTTTITLALGSNPGAATLSGTLTQTVTAGIASFNNLSLNTADAGYTLTATSSPTHTPTTSNSFTIDPGAPAKLAFTTQPSTTTAGTSINPAVQVSLEDSLGNTITTDNTTTITLALGSNPGAATLSGTLTQTVTAGIASFNNLSLNTADAGYTLTATSSPTHTPTTSNSFTIDPGAPAKLAFTTQPSTTTAGTSINPAVQVSLEDSLGNTITTDNTTTITLALGSNPGAATLSGTLTQTVTAGIASFNNLSLNTADAGYTLTATSSPTHTPTTSNSFTIDPGAPAKLAFTTQPSTTTAGTSINPAVQVSLEDSLGNTITTDNTTTITLALGSNPGAATLSGTLTQTVTAGIASFNNLSLNTADAGYTLTATSSPTHTPTTSNSFTIDPGAPAKLAFTTQPSTTTAGTSINPAVQVSLEDSLGNTITTDNTTTITLALGSNPGAATLSGTLTQTVTAGIASFNNLSLNTADAGYTLTATSSPTHTPTTSNSFTINVPAVGETLLATDSGNPCTSGASCSTASISPSAGETLLILIQRGGSTSAGDGVVSVSGPLTSASGVVGLEYPGAFSGNYLFAISATASGATGSITVNFAPGTNANPTVVEVIGLSGNDTSTPVAQAPTDSGTSLLFGGASADLASPSAGDGEFIMVSFLANQTIVTPAGFTAVDSFVTGSNGGEDYAVFFDPSAQASTSITAPGLGFLTGWGSVALEINHG